MKRAKPEWTTKPDAASRISVPLTGAQRTEILDAMNRDGIQTMADFLRFAALRMARAKE